MDLVLQILSWLTEEERKGIKQAQDEGIAEAKKKGKHLGRPQIYLNTLTVSQRALLNKGYAEWKDGLLTDILGSIFFAIPVIVTIWILDLNEPQPITFLPNIIFLFSSCYGIEIH
ncbi:hypothetical protein ABE099_14060 [Paenibacillus turicensis]|uniref:hypothetical protein n=1 Tax=Paenibacillus turicensis TaxID=160487 RepID=UPI003D28E8BC